jgi:putative ABC transport system permease protein
VNPFIVLRIAFKALLRNTMRSFLTMLGVIIGVGAVIAMVAIGEGAKARVEASFAAMGTNLLIIMSGSSSSGGARGGYGSQPTLTWDDMKAIQNEVGTVRFVAPQLRTSGQLMSEEGNWSTSVYGVSPEYFDIRSWGMSQGARFSAQDVETGAKVVILGQTVVDKLFGRNAEPLGQSVRIKNIPFTVVAVMERKGQSAMGQDYDDSAYIPYSTFGAKIQGGLKKYLSGTVYVSAVSGNATSQAQKDITNLLRDRHNTQPGADDDFSIRNLAELADAQQEGTKTLTTLLASIAAVSLLVGGIGIMNIMLVSVTERTREIGIRLAIGALEREVLLQFLIEAVALASLGGIIGIVLATLASIGGAALMHVPYLFNPAINLLSFGFSAAIGVVFGYVPARRAARLDPIEALRHE